MLQASFRSCHRFIPTCVGNTMLSAACPALVAVHPHVRGEYAEKRGRTLPKPGSSPRAWGIPLDARRGRDGQRFIPTCVGNTGATAGFRSIRPVHPHVRGEYFLSLRRKDGHGGSSPRAWGIQRAPCRRGNRLRFIPTCVGNTVGVFKQTIKVTVHPHVRGEYVTVPRRPPSTAGSSPRAWGIQILRRGKRGGLRFIPTCVGNTACSLCS